MIELVVIIGLFFTLLPLLIYYNKRNTNRSIKDIWNKSDRGLVVHDNVSLFSNVEDWLFEKGYSNIESEDEFNSVSQELSKIAIFSNYDEQIEIKLISCINKNVFFGIVNVDYSFKSGYANDRFSEYQFIGIVRNKKDVNISKLIIRLIKYFDIRDKVLERFVKSNPIKCEKYNNKYFIKSDESMDYSDLPNFVALLISMDKHLNS